MKHLLPLLVVGARQKFGAPQEEKNMENIAIVVVFALTLVAIVALGRGIRGKLGGIEIATQNDSISRSKKNSR
jgi:hypothetical protein